MLLLDWSLRGPHHCVFSNVSSIYASYHKGHPCLRWFLLPIAVVPDMLFKSSSSVVLSESESVSLLVSKFDGPLFWPTRDSKLDAELRAGARAFTSAMRIFLSLGSDFVPLAAVVWLNFNFVDCCASSFTGQTTFGALSSFIPKSTYFSESAVFHCNSLEDGLPLLGN